MEKFETLVAKAVDQLPEKVLAKMENVSLCVEKTPSREQKKKLGMRRGELLLGLYEGVPQTEWGRGLLPDKITIFQEPIEQIARSEEKLVQLVQETVKHEIKHHFGFTDQDLEKGREAS